MIPDNVKKVFEDKDLRDRLSGNALKSAGERSWEEQVKKLNEILNNSACA